MYLDIIQIQTKKLNMVMHEAPILIQKKFYF